jgi:hypothetical protein
VRVLESYRLPATNLVSFSRVDLGIVAVPSVGASF